MQQTITLSPQEASDALKEYFRLVRGINITSVNFTASQNYDCFDRPSGGYSLTSVVLNVEQMIKPNKVLIGAGGRSYISSSLAAQIAAVESDSRPYGDR